MTSIWLYAKVTFNVKLYAGRKSQIFHILLVFNALTTMTLSEFRNDVLCNVEWWGYLAVWWLD